MSSTAPTKRNHTTNSLSDGSGLLGWLKPFLTSSVGTKFIVALTGLSLVGFVLAHLAGNLLIFAGPEKINAYAKMLKDQGPLLYVARGGLLVIFVLHMFLASRLRLKANSARPIPYAYPNTIQASRASRTMILTGLVIMAFVAFHLAHYTWGEIASKPAISKVDAVPGSTGSPTVKLETSYSELLTDKGNHDVYSMVVDGFRRPLIAILYLFAQFALFLHLSHGIPSTFQTLGINHPRFQKAINAFGFGVALLILLGNSAIVIAVWAGMLPEVDSFAPSALR